MLNKRLAVLGVAGEDVEHASRQADFHCQLSERERGEWRVLCRLDDDGIAGGESGRDLPREHEQREVPGNDLADDATSSVVGKFLIEELGPAGVVIEMAGDKRNVDVAALANGLAVVHGFEHGEAARMLLHLAGQRVEIASAFVAAESLPCGQSFASGGDGGVDVVDVAESDLCQYVAGRRVAGGHVLAADGRNECTADELIEAAVMTSSHWLASSGSSGATPYSMV